MDSSNDDGGSSDSNSYTSDDSAEGGQEYRDSDLEEIFEKEAPLRRNGIIQSAALNVKSYPKIAVTAAAKSASPTASTANKTKPAKTAEQEPTKPKKSTKPSAKALNNNKAATKAVKKPETVAKYAENSTSKDATNGKAGVVTKSKPKNAKSKSSTASVYLKLLQEIVVDNKYKAMTLPAIFKEATLRNPNSEPKVLKRSLKKAFKDGFERGLFVRSAKQESLGAMWVGTIKINESKMNKVNKEPKRIGDKSTSVKTLAVSKRKKVISTKRLSLTRRLSSRGTPGATPVPGRSKALYRGTLGATPVVDRSKTVRSVGNKNPAATKQKNTGKAATLKDVTYTFLNNDVDAKSKTVTKKTRMTKAKIKLASPEIPVPDDATVQFVPLAEPKVTEEKVSKGKAVSKKKNARNVVAENPKVTRKKKQVSAEKAGEGDDTFVPASIDLSEQPSPKALTTDAAASPKLPTKTKRQQKKDTVALAKASSKKAGGNGV